jgi:dihydrofolate reductase
MARLIYSALASLDGYVADRDGIFDWAAPDDEVHRFVNDLQRQVGTMLLGRSMYDVLVVWEAMDTAGAARRDPGLRRPVARERQGGLLEDARARGERPDQDRA